MSWCSADEDHWKHLVIVAISGPYQGHIRAVSGSDQGRIRAISGPYQGHIRAISGPYQGSMIDLSLFFVKGCLQASF